MKTFVSTKLGKCHARCNRSYGGTCYETSRRTGYCQTVFVCWHPRPSVDKIDLFQGSYYFMSRYKSFLFIIILISVQIQLILYFFPIIGLTTNPSKFLLYITPQFNVIFLVICLFIQKGFSSMAMFLFSFYKFRKHSTRLLSPLTPKKC